MEERITGFVLDCSVTMAWCYDDEATAYTNGVRDSLIEVGAIVPALWRLEVANATLIGERRKRLDEAGGSRFLILLNGLPIAVDGETATRAWADTRSLARAHNLSVYDATYLELAVRLGLPLAALDGKLKAAALAVGVRLYVVA